MLGVAWFVEVVHYPLFARVGKTQFRTYHAEHSSRTSLVVIMPMIVELASSVWLAFDPPTGSSGDPLQTLAIAGAILAALTWIVTFGGAVPAHQALEPGFDSAIHRRLMRSNLIRTVIWTAHAGVVVAILASV
ncbi:MAG: hypothetical protein ACKOPI_03900 [bacterium]